MSTTNLKSSQKSQMSHLPVPGDVIERLSKIYHQPLLSLPLPSLQPYEVIHHLDLTSQVRNIAYQNHHHQHRKNILHVVEF